MLFRSWMNDLEAIRVGRWKLHFSKRGTETSELYDLDADIAESVDVFAQHPDVVATLSEHAERARASLGDARLGRIGSDVRLVGRVDNARPLTTYDENHPYLIAEYDLSDRGYPSEYARRNRVPSCIAAEVRCMSFRRESRCPHCVRLICDVQRTSACVHYSCSWRW